LPDVHFPREPEEDDYAMAVFPDDDNPEYDQPMIYDKGDVRPLLPDEIEMPEVPDDEEVLGADDDADDDTSQQQVTGEGGTAGGPPAGVDDQRVAELADAVAEADDITPEHAQIAAENMVSMP